MLYLRLIALLALISCFSMLQGCQAGGTRAGAAAPPSSLCHSQRLGTEMGWLFANVNDVLFGINYYPHFERKYGTGPYREPEDNRD